MTLRSVSCISCVTQHDTADLCRWKRKKRRRLCKGSWWSVGGTLCVVPHWSVYGLPCTVLRRWIFHPRFNVWYVRVQSSPVIYCLQLWSGKFPRPLGIINNTVQPSCFHCGWNLIYCYINTIKGLRSQGSKYFASLCKNHVNPGKPLASKGWKFLVGRLRLWLIN